MWGGAVVATRFLPGLRFGVNPAQCRIELPYQVAERGIDCRPAADHDVIMTGTKRAFRRQPHHFP